MCNLDSDRKTKFLNSYTKKPGFSFEKRGFSIKFSEITDFYEQTLMVDGETTYPVRL